MTDENIQDAPVEEEDKVAAVETINGREIKFYFPSELQMVAYLTRIQRISDDDERVAFIMGFMSSLLDPDDEIYFWDQVQTRKSGMTIRGLLDILDRVLETVTGKAQSTASTSIESGGSTKPSSTESAPSKESTP